MVFQKPTPFPSYIYEQYARGVRLFEKLSRADGRGACSEALTKRIMGQRNQRCQIAPGEFTLSPVVSNGIYWPFARDIAIRPEVFAAGRGRNFALDPTSLPGVLKSPDHRS